LIEGLPDAVYYEIRTILPLSILTDTQKVALEKASKEYIHGQMKEYFEELARIKWLRANSRGNSGINYRRIFIFVDV